MYLWKERCASYMLHTHKIDARCTINYKTVCRSNNPYVVLRFTLYYRYINFNFVCAVL